MLPLPPVYLADDFLGPALHQRLLGWTLANKARFTPATVVRGLAEDVARESRSNLKLGDLGPVDDDLRAALNAALPAIARALGCAAPARPVLELELSAYGAGDFYHEHIDTVARDSPVGDGSTRLISAVYYFHARPRAFEGGALRLLPWEPGADSSHRDIDPVDNRLVAFLSWTRHAVLPVHCEGDHFADRRFAVNCWFVEG